MNKNMKKVLSYALGIILAMGIGLTYAYAVGANDSNAFVTKTEWQNKIAQLETKLDNVAKTIDDTNMDFVLSGSRLQVSIMDGLENCAGTTRNSNGHYSPSSYHASSLANLANIYPKWNELYLIDQWDGRQRVYKNEWPTGDTSYEIESPNCRFALATTTPGYYIIVTVYYTSGITFHYVKLDKYPYTTSIPAMNLVVKLHESEWGNRVINSGIGAYGRSSNALLAGQVYTNTYINWTSGSADGYSTSGAYITRTKEGEYWSTTFEFPANTWAMKSIGVDTFPFHPVDMTTRKFGTIYDSVVLNPTGSNGQVAKVYSPTKGCLALKSYINGEIPILNE